jgi:glucosamine-phosphate N-acetyltransferase
MMSGAAPARVAAGGAGSSRQQQQRTLLAFALGVAAAEALRLLLRRRCADAAAAPPPAAPATFQLVSPKRPDAKPVTVRRLRASDQHRGFYGLLGQLTQVGDVAAVDFRRRFEEMASGPELVYVVESECGSRVVACGTLVLERKFIRSCATCGHIEDVVVDAEERGKDLGRLIIQALTKVAQECGCYKTILDCSEENAGFYERCGFKRKEIQMAKYFV